MLACRDTFNLGERHIVGVVVLPMLGKNILLFVTSKY
jgi:hypothetical protein